MYEHDEVTGFEDELDIARDVFFDDEAVDAWEWSVEGGEELYL